MIKLGLLQGKPVINQYPERPLIYLDHWGIRKISTKNDLKTKFSQLLAKKNGTLVLSLVNFMEFSLVEDIAHRNAFEQFIEFCFPNIFFIEFEPFSVIAGENQNHQYSSTVGDNELLKLFENRMPKSFDGIDVMGVVEDFNDQIVRNSIVDIKEVFVMRVKEIRNQIEQSEKVKRDALRPISKRQINFRTQIIMRELIRQYIVDNRLIIDPNDAMDFYHTTVPVSYCDIVGLDKKWCSHVQKVQKILRDVNLAIKLALCCSSVEEIMKSLEKY